MTATNNSSQHPEGRTLVIHTGGIGDFLLSCPSLAALGATTSLELCGYPDRLELAVEAGIADRAFSTDAIDLHSGFAEPSEKFAERVRDYDRVIVWMRDASVLVANLRACGVSHVDTFPGLPTETSTRHASEYYADCLGVAVGTDWRLDIAAEGEPLDVVIHPGSGSKTKNWPLERFEGVAHGLMANGRGVTWAVGPAEIETGLDIDPGNTLAGIPLITLAKRLAAARLYLGNDCGITHLAASLGVPTIAIFGPTNPCVWAPRGERVRVVRGRPWPGLADVLDAVESLAKQGRR